jgi:hypothetical protein
MFFVFAITLIASCNSKEEMQLQTDEQVEQQLQEITQEQVWENSESFFDPLPSTEAFNQILQQMLAEGHIESQKELARYAGYHQQVLDIRNDLIDHQKDNSAFCLTTCGMLLDECMWWVNSFDVIILQCEAWVQFCSNEPIPPSWCMNWMSYSACEPYYQARFDHWEEIAQETTDCYNEYFQCMEDCDHGGQGGGIVDPK